MAKDEKVDLDLSKTEEGQEGPQVEFAMAPGVKTIIRTLGGSPNHQLGIFAVEEVDAYLTGFLNDGWRLVMAEMGGKHELDGSIVFDMVYVLVR
jgi:hypothetical protein